MAGRRGTTEQEAGADGGSAAAAERTRLGPRFAHLLAATGLSNLADGIPAVGVLLLAVTLTRSPALVSLVSTASWLPWLLLSLHAGVLIDRHERVRTLLLAAAARVLVLVTAVVLAATGALTFPLLLVLIFAFGCAEVFADSTATVLVPAVVPAHRLAAANSRLMGLEQVANDFLGAPLACLALAAGAGWLFGIPAALCAVAGLLVIRGFRRKQRPGDGPVAPPDAVGQGLAGDVPDARPSMATELRAGLTHLRHHRVVGPLLLTGTVLNFASAGYFAVLVLWLVGPGSRVGLPATAYGVLAAGGVVGEVFGLPTVFLGAVALSAGAVLWVIRRVPQARIDEADAGIPVDERLVRGVTNEVDDGRPPARHGLRGHRASAGRDPRCEQGVRARSQGARTDCRDDARRTAGRHRAGAGQETGPDHAGLGSVRVAATRPRLGAWVRTFRLTCRGESGG